MECCIVKLPSSLGEIPMRLPVIALVLTFAVGCGGYAFAADDASQPLTRADCEAAGMNWNDGANVCGGSEQAAPASDASAAGGGETVAQAQPLTRADCEAAGMTWNDGSNVCGSGAATQPLSRADCEATGMRWNDDRNVCGVGRAAGGGGTVVVKKVIEKGGKKVVIKKVTTQQHGTKKVTIHKKTVEPGKKERRGFFQWLNGKSKPKPS